MIIFAGQTIKLYATKLVFLFIICRHLFHGFTCIKDKILFFYIWIFLYPGDYFIFCIITVNCPRCRKRCTFVCHDLHILLCPVQNCSNYSQDVVLSYIRIGGCWNNSENFRLGRWGLRMNENGKKFFEVIWIHRTLL